MAIGIEEPKTVLLTLIKGGSEASIWHESGNTFEVQGFDADSTSTEDLEAFIKDSTAQARPLLSSGDSCEFTQDAKEAGRAKVKSTLGSYVSPRLKNIDLSSFKYIERSESIH